VTVLVCWQAPRRRRRTAAAAAAVGRGRLGPRATTTVDVIDDVIVVATVTSRRVRAATMTSPAMTSWRSGRRARRRTSAHPAAAAAAAARSCLVTGESISSICQKTEERRRPATLTTDASVRYAAPHCLHAVCVCQRRIASRTRLCLPPTDGRQTTRSFFILPSAFHIIKFYL